MGKKVTLSPLTTISTPLIAAVSPATGTFPVIAMAASVGGLKALSVILPRASIATGDVDFILPLDDIAPKLIELVKRLYPTGSNAAMLAPE